MIDWQRVNTLREEVGSEDFPEVVDLFLDEVEEVVSRLQKAPDPKSLGSDLHFLKGSAQGLGFVAFAEICQTGETQCAKGDAQNFDIPALLIVYEDSKRLFLEEMPIALVS